MTADSNFYFETSHLRQDLRGHSIRAGTVTILAHATRFIVRMGSTFVLARLLSPQDYGLIGMVTVVTGFISLFKDIGLSNATIQKADINHKQVSTLFWINFALGTALTLLVVKLAPVIAWFYNEPRLTSITLVLASNFIISSISIQHQALLKRQMCFGLIAKINILAMVLSIITAIYMALLGAGYWSLIGMQIVETLIGTAGIWMACNWRPGLPTWDSGVYSMINHGMNLSGFRFVNYFSRNLDNILIGRFWGSQQLGLYAKAYQLLLFPIQQINGPLNSIALSALSSLQLETHRYRRFYYKAILAISFLGMPLVMFLFATTDKLILLLLGQQWLDIVPIFQFLMPTAFVGTFNVALGWVFQSLGRTDRQFRLGIVISTINIVIFLVSVPKGVLAVAAAYGISQPILMIPAIIYCFKGTPLTVADLAKTLAKPTLASIGAAAILITINQVALINVNLVICLLLYSLIYGLAYLGIWMLMPNGKSTLLELLSLIRELKRKRKNSSHKNVRSNS